MITEEEKINFADEQIIAEEIRNRKYTYEETAQYLHYHADRFDKEIIKDLVDKNLSSAYNAADLAKSLRIAANFIDGVQGT